MFAALLIKCMFASLDVDDDQWRGGQGESDLPICAQLDGLMGPNE